MADIELVIKITEEDYKEIKEYGINTFPSVAIAIQNGTPLPKGHGRLIDADKLETDIEEYDEEWTWYGSRRGYSTEQVYDAPTIIEADKE